MSPVNMLLSVLSPRTHVQVAHDTFISNDAWSMLLQHMPRYLLLLKPLGANRTETKVWVASYPSPHRHCSGGPHLRAHQLLLTDIEAFYLHYGAGGLRRDPPA